MSADSTLRNVKWGLVNGMSFATLVAMFVCVLALARGSVRFDTYGLTLWTILLVYFSGGLVGGLLLGLLRPVADSQLGAGFVGFLVAIPSIVGMTWSMYGPVAHWKSHMITDIVFESVLLGGGMGCWFWLRAKQREDTDNLSQSAYDE